jgi:GNAT superfamily N-acetyltransferase
MDITFRVAQLSDIDHLLVFMREYYEYDHLPFQPEEARIALEMIINDPSFGYVWLICEANQAVGYLVITLGFSLEYQGRDAFLDEIYIREAYRGQGIGAQAFEFMVQACRELGVNAVHLEVERANTKAQEFYRKVGFEDHDRYLLTKWIKK